MKILQKFLTILKFYIHANYAQETFIKKLEKYAK